MSHFSSDIELLAGLSATVAPYSRATSRNDVVATLQKQLQELTQSRAMQLMWQADGVHQSLFTSQPTLRMPAASEWLQLANGHLVEGGNTIYVPMLVAGQLRGWVALQATTVPAAVQDVVAYAGFALALLEQQSYQGSASRELATMDKIGRLLASTLELDQLLPNLGAIVRDLVVADTFFIALADETGTQLKFASLWSKDGNRLQMEPWTIDSGLTGLIMRSGSPIVTDDYLSECERRNITPQKPDGQEFSRAWLGVPMCHHEQVLGVIVAGMDTPNVAYADADVHMLSSIAAQAAAAVANAQLYKRVEQQANQLALINRIGKTISATLDPQEVPMLIMQALKTALGVEDGAVLIEDAATGDLVVRYSLEPKIGLRLPRGMGIAGDVLAQQQVLIVNNMQNDARLYAPLDIEGIVQTRSVICAPLTGRQQLRGVIQLRNKRGGPFTAADAQVLEAVAEQAAVALENAELYSHTDSALAAHVADLEQRNQQLTNIVAISNALRSTNDLRAVGRQIVSTIQAMTGSPRIVVALVEPEQQRVRVMAQVGLDPAYITTRRELWVPLPIVRNLLHEIPLIGTVTYRLGQHELAPGFADAIVLTLLDANGVLVGLIEFDNADLVEPLSPALIKELEIIVNQASSAIINARLATEQEQTVDRLTALNALSLTLTTSQYSTDEIMQMTVHGAIGTTNGVGGGAYVIRRDDTQRHFVLDLPPDCATDLLPLLEQVSEDYVELDEQAIPLTLQAHGVRHLLVVPVRGAKLALGHMWIGYGDTGIAPTEREMVVLYAKTAGGVLENLRLFDQVSAAHDRLASILASTAEGMLMATAQGKIAAANAAFVQLLGLPGDADAIEGQLVYDVCYDPSLAAIHNQLDPIYNALLSVAQHHSTEHSGEISVTTPVPRDLAWSVLPVRGTARQQSAALLVLHDVTAERQAEKLRQDLTHMIVHDLRAPLTNIMVSVDLMLKQMSGPLTASQERILEIAGTSSQQMLDLVNALLDIRRLEQRQLELQRQPVELFELVESVFERLQQIAQDRRIDLKDQTATLPPIHADIDLIRRVVQNLVDNAIKFSPRDKTVQVSAIVATEADLPLDHPAGRWAIVSIADQGPGVPDTYRGVIFQLFGQAPQGRGQGTGLGLAFCRLAAEAHGGQIWVEDAPGGGAVFRFTVPLA